MSSCNFHLLPTCKVEDCDGAHVAQSPGQQPAPVCHTIVHVGEPGGEASVRVKDHLQAINHVFKTENSLVEEYHEHQE